MSLDNDWKEAYTVQKAIADGLRERVAVLEAELKTRPSAAPDTVSLPSHVELAVIDYSFGDEQLQAKTRSLAIRMLGAGVEPDELVRRIREGA